MRAIINKKIYNTKTAKLIVETSNGLGRSDYSCVEEDLYLTKKGQFFIHFYGGPASKYAESKGQYRSQDEGIKLVSEHEAYDFLETKKCYDEIEKHFKSEIEEG